MKITRRMERLRAAYLGDARGDPGMACTLAGYKQNPNTSPAHAWHVLKRRNPKFIASLEQEFIDQMIMKGREIDERLTAIARDPEHRDHYKALELLAKMAGKLKEQVVVVDRKALYTELDALIAAERAQREATANAN